MKKVYLGVGHGGSDSGAVGYIVEKDVNLQIALACKEYLEANGVEIKISRTTDKDKELTERIKECNAYNPELAIDIHNNAGGGDGFEVFHTIYGGTGKILAQNIEKEIIAIGQNSRGLKTKKNSSGSDYFGFIRQISCPSIITETAFVDNKADAEQIDELSEQKAFGEAIAKGILKTLGINIATPMLQCDAHIEDIGWTGYKDTSKEIIGTEGQGRRLEAIKFKADKGLKIEYRTHVENIGWQDWKKSEEVAGTTGQALRIEAIEIKCNKDLEVQEHIENIGWMPSSKGTHIRIGTEGKALRLEAFKIRIL